MLNDFENDLPLFEGAQTNVEIPVNSDDMFFHAEEGRMEEIERQGRDEGEKKGMELNAFGREQLGGKEKNE